MSRSSGQLFAAARLSLLLIAGLSLYTPALIRGQEAAVAGKRYAVLVGVENYDHANLRSPPLKYSVDDVTELARVLEKSGYTVTLLTDDTGKSTPDLAPTRANIDARIKRTLHQCRPEDTVVLAFAGHGLQFAGQKEAYFCPQDARPFQQTADSLVPISSIYGELEASFAGVKVILVDACRNDPDPGRGRGGLDIDAVPPPKGVAALFSCSAGQRAFEHDDLKHGVFFHHVLKGLQADGANAKGDVTFYSLAGYLSESVPETMTTLFPERQQQPNFKADLIGRAPVLVRVAVPTIPKIPLPSSPILQSMPVPQIPGPGSAADTLAGEVQEFTGQRIKFCWCPPGTFQMGSPDSDMEAFHIEIPQHSVTLTKGFWLGQTEVTQEQWQSVMGTQPWQGQKYVKAGASYPATCVSHEDAKEFCRKLTDQERAASRLKSSQSYELPTEAQWEYACRAGTTTLYSFGDDASQLKEYAWCDQNNISDIGEESASGVGLKKPNPWKLYDMLGNTSELCEDWYDVYAVSPSNDPSGPSTGLLLTARGGYWGSPDRYCRSAQRFHHDPSYRDSILGFRVALSPSGK